MSNIYYNPEAFGLMVIGELDPGESYKFDTFVVWKDSNGTFLWDSDCGCSCPSPFEYSTLATVSKGNKGEAIVAALKWAGESYRQEMLIEAHGLVRKILDSE